ncbi:MAG: hypothetical protein ACK5Y2_13380 [Bdellovibrionales bacterium]
MKTFLLLFLAYFEVVFAKGFVCQTNPQDVRVEIQQIQDQVRLRVQTPLGYSYLPQFEAGARSAELPWMRYQAEQLTSLGKDFEVAWPASSCRFEVHKSKANTRLECSGPALAEVRGVSFYSAQVTRVTESSFAGVFRTRRLRLVVGRQGNQGPDTFFVSIPVAESFCDDYE